MAIRRCRMGVFHGFRNVSPSELPQIPDGPLQIPLLAVLSELALALQTRDLHLDPHNHLEHVVQVVGRRITHLPRAWLPGLMCAREPSYDAPNESLVVEDPQ